MKYTFGKAACAFLVVQGVCAAKLIYQVPVAGGGTDYATVEVVVGAEADITQQNDIDVIVSAANEGVSSPGDGGVAGAIRAAAGPAELDAYINKHNLAPIAPGQVAVTPAFNLPNKFIIHAHGPRSSGGEPTVGQKKTLSFLYQNILAAAASLASKNGLKSLAIPAISTGIFGFDKKTAAKIAIDRVINAYPPELKLIRFVFTLDDVGKENAALYIDALSQYPGIKKPDVQIAGDAIVRLAQMQSEGSVGDWSALETAISKNDVAQVKELVGYDKSIKPSSKNIKGLTPLQLAVDYQNSGVDNTHVIKYLEGFSQKGSPGAIAAPVAAPTPVAPIVMPVPMPLAAPVAPAPVVTTTVPAAILTTSKVKGKAKFKPTKKMKKPSKKSVKYAYAKKQAKPKKIKAVKVKAVKIKPVKKKYVKPAPKKKPKKVVVKKVKKKPVPKAKAKKPRVKKVIYTTP